MAKLELGPTTLLGQSWAGLGTTMVLKERKLCFDLGVDLRAALSCDHVFISHGHTDHLGAIFNYLAVRVLENRNLATFYVPPSIGERLHDVLKSWCALSESVLDYRIFEVHPGATVPLRNGLSVTAFPLVHAPACQGYLLQETVEKLHTQFQSLPGGEIARLKQEKTEGLFYQEVRPLFAYIGDTLPEGLDGMPEEVWKARILAVESTYLDDQKPMEKVRMGKHLHLDDIAQRAERFEGEHLLLYHFSQLYSAKEIPGLVSSRFPAAHRDKVRLFL